MALAVAEDVAIGGQLAPSKYVKKPDFRTNNECFSSLH